MNDAKAASLNGMYIRSQTSATDPMDTTSDAGSWRTACAIGHACHDPQQPNRSSKRLRARQFAFGIR